MTTGSSAIDLLLDVVFTMDGTTGGDNGTLTRTAAASPVTFLADKVSLSNKRTLADHSVAQQSAPIMRTTKITPSMTIETKLEKKTGAALLALLISANGVIVNITATAVGCNITTSPFIVESYEADYAGPSTLKIVLQPYGTAVAQTTT